MRMLIKRLLKKHEYPPEGMEDAVKTVMAQCELWADNIQFEPIHHIYEQKDHSEYTDGAPRNLPMVAEIGGEYN